MFLPPQRRLRRPVRRLRPWWIQRWASELYLLRSPRVLARWTCRPTARLGKHVFFLFEDCYRRSVVFDFGRAQDHYYRKVLFFFGWFQRFVVLKVTLEVWSFWCVEAGGMIFLEERVSGVVWTKKHMFVKSRVLLVGLGCFFLPVWRVVFVVSRNAFFVGLGEVLGVFWLTDPEDEGLEFKILLQSDFFLGISRVFMWSVF